MADIKRDFNADRATCDAATSGPWVAITDISGSYVESKMEGRLVAETSETCVTFIAEARSGWPAALDEIARLEAEVREYKAENERLELDSLVSAYREITRLDAEIERLQAVYDEYAMLTRVLAVVMAETLRNPTVTPEVRAFAGHVNDCVLDGNSTIKSEVSRYYDDAEEEGCGPEGAD